MYFVVKEFYLAAAVVSRYYLCTLMSLSKHIAPQPIAQQPITMVLFMEQSMKPSLLKECMRIMFLALFVASPKKRAVNMKYTDACRGLWPARLPWSGTRPQWGKYMYCIYILCHRNYIVSFHCQVSSIVNTFQGSLI